MGYLWKGVVNFQHSMLAFPLASSTAAVAVRYWVHCDARDRYDRESMGRVQSFMF